MTPSYIGTTEAARALGVTTVTLGRWVKTGKVRPAYTTPGGHYRWDIDDLRRQIGITTTHREDPMPEPSTKPVAQPVVAAVVTSEKGLLLTWRTDKTPPAGFLTGEIEPGESPADAMIRECKEEAGIRVTAGVELGRRVHPRTGRTLIYVAGRPSGEEDVILGDEAELTAVRWVSLAEADEAFEPFGGMFSPVHEYVERELARR